MIKKAIPTDFMGIRFRSKSEAMFANMLENRNLRWIYEPKFLEVEEYVPDFLVAHTSNNTLRLEVVEYKPQKPTDAYFRNLAEKREIISARLGMMPKSFSIVCVNFFAEYNIEIWSVMPNGAWKKIEDHVFDYHDFCSAKEYRYDLDQHPSVDCGLSSYSDRYGPYSY